MLNLAITLAALSLPLSSPSVSVLTQDSRPAKSDKAEAGKQEKVVLPDSKDSADPALTKIGQFIADAKINKTERRWKSLLSKPPVLTFTKSKEYHWNLETNKGVIDIRLMPDVAPMHVSSTIFLTRVGFYDDITFHRVIKGFMAQGGCPVGRGTGGPGYSYSGEFDPKVKHDRPGLLSMANSGAGTDGSQFFLTFVPTPHLNGKHTIFGEVVKGMDTVKKLEAGGSPGGKTEEPLKIIRSTISVQAKTKKSEHPTKKGEHPTKKDEHPKKKGK